MHQDRLFSFVVIGLVVCLTCYLSLLLLFAYLEQDQSRQSHSLQWGMERHGLGGTTLTYFVASDISTAVRINVIIFSAIKR